VELVKPDPHCSWKGNSRRMGTGVRDESTEFCSIGVCGVSQFAVIGHKPLVGA